MKIFFFSFLLIILHINNRFPVVAADDIVNNQTLWLHAGGIYSLHETGGIPNKEYWGGSTVLLDWRDFEPIEGQYQWGLLDSVSSYQSWQHFMACGCPTPDNCDNDSSTPNPNCSYMCGCDNPARFLESPGKVSRDSHTNGKTLRLKIRTTDGAVPLWLFGGEGRKERKAGMQLPMSSYGNLCANKVLGQGFDCNANSNTNPMRNDIVISYPYPPFPDHEDSVHPVPWNAKYHEKLRTMLLAVGDYIKAHPDFSNSIEFVEASVGNFGEMILSGKGCWKDYNRDNYTDDGLRYRKPTPIATPTIAFDCNCDAIKIWTEAGFTNKTYGDAVLDILSIYMEAFPKHPVALSTGNGLYPPAKATDPATCADDTLPESAGRSLEKYVLDNAMERWGGRLYLKFAGFGGDETGSGRKGIFNTYCPSVTKCILENAYSITTWSFRDVGWPFTENPTYFGEIFKKSIAFGANILMLWPQDFREIIKADTDNNSIGLESQLAYWSKYMQPQIGLRDGDSAATFTPSTFPAGSVVSVASKWSADSTFAPYTFKRIFNLSTQTYKDIPTSYPIYIDFVKENNNDQVMYKTTFIPTTGTKTWKKSATNVQAKEINTTDKIFIPWSIPSGTYTPEIGLAIDVGGSILWKLGGRDDSGKIPYGRYKLASNSINITTPTSNPMFFRRGWNIIHWTDVPDFKVSFIPNACTTFTVPNGKSFIRNYYFPNALTNFTPNQKLYVRCKNNIWN